MEGGGLLKEKYKVEPIPEHIAISKLVQVGETHEHMSKKDDRCHWAEGMLVPSKDVRAHGLVS